jgi:phage host-nuclease inhibitor protein Gam
MAKLKRASSMVRAPKDMEEASIYLDRIGAAMRERATIEGDLNDQVALLRAGAEAKANPIDLEVDQLTKGLQLWAEANRAALTKDGATKTIRLATGEIAWRRLPPKVSIRGGVEAMVERLQQLSLTKFLRTKVELDKEAMLREPAAAKAVPGITIGSEGEEFVVTPAHVELPEAAGAVAA